MRAADRSDDVVTVLRLVSLGRADRGDVNSSISSIVTTVGQASLRTEGDTFLLVTRDESALRRLRAGEIVHGVADRFGVVWRAEQRTDDTGVKESGQ
jgi:hypothetical protein